MYSTAGHDQICLRTSFSVMLQPTLVAAMVVKMALARLLRKESKGFVTPKHRIVRSPHVTLFSSTLIQAAHKVNQLFQTPSYLSPQSRGMVRPVAAALLGQQASGGRL